MKYLLPILLLLAVIAGCTQTNEPMTASPTAWVAQRTGTSQDIVDVFFIDAVHGWAVCRFDTVLRTTDAGSTWVPYYCGLPSSPGLSLASVHFTDQYNGWGVGRDGIIMRTTDGGRGWAQQPYTTSNTAYNTSPLNGIFFVDRNNGWVVGGTRFGILKTTDAGSSWSHGEDVKTSFDSAGYDQLQSVTFIDARHGWVVGTRQFGNSNRAPSGVVAATADGGETWTAQIFPDVQVLDRVVFADSLVGWVAGDRGAIFRTTDAGRTWTRQSTGTDATVLSIFFVDRNNGWAVIDRPNVMSGRQEFRMILQTTDGGDNWRFQDQSVTLANLTVLLDIFFVDRNNGWAVGTNGTIWRTTTGGMVL